MSKIIRGYIMERGLQSCLQLFQSARFDETRAFYERLGFRSVAYMDSEQPHVCLYRDGIEFILTKSRLTEIVPARETHGYGYDAYIISGDQESFLETVRRAGARIVKDLNLTDYANREFIFEDNERRWIAVGRKVDSDVVQGLTLSHAAFVCRDIGAMEAFYRDVFGLRRVRVFNPGTEKEFFVLGRDNFRVELFRGEPSAFADTARSADASGAGLSVDRQFKHLAVEVSSLDNVMRLLAEKGVPVDRVIDYSTEGETFKLCFIRDPEGNKIEIMEGYRDEA